MCECFLVYKSKCDTCFEIFSATPPITHLSSSNPSPPLIYKYTHAYTDIYAIAANIRFDNTGEPGARILPQSILALEELVNSALELTSYHEILQDREYTCARTEA
jgi:hypothetical protein